VTVPQPTGNAARARQPERVVVHVDSPTARWTGALAVLAGFGWLAGLLIHDHYRLDWQPGSRLVAILVAVVFIARGIYLGRPVTAAHAGAAIIVAAIGVVARVLSFDLLSDMLIAGAGLVLMLPTAARPQPEALPRVWALVDQTHADPLAPFAMQSQKSYYFSPDGLAAIAYATRVGFAVVSADPIGDQTRFAELVAGFTAMCRSKGWRILVLACSESTVALWRQMLGRSFRAIPIGRDVVVDVARFRMVGRKFRNLRQAVQRTHNVGLTTEVIDEQDAEDAVRAELAQVVRASPSGARTDRGFSMTLNGLLQARYPGVLLIIGRDRRGRVQGFQRYALAGGGNDVSLDTGWRQPEAPNGIDERLTVDMIQYARAHSGRRVSLAFAAFPEIFADGSGTRQKVFYTLIHLLDPLIKLESLYRYLRKFQALGNRRYVVLPLRQLLPALWVLLTLEFLPRRRHLPPSKAGDDTITPRQPGRGSRSQM